MQALRLLGGGREPQGRLPGARQQAPGQEDPAQAGHQGGGGRVEDQAIPGGGDGGKQEDGPVVHGKVPGGEQVVRMRTTKKKEESATTRRDFLKVERPPHVDVTFYVLEKGPKSLVGHTMCPTGLLEVASVTKFHLGKTLNGSVVRRPTHPFMSLSVTRKVSSGTTHKKK